MIEAGIFYLLAVTTVGSAIAVVSVKNVFHAALFLILSLMGVAGVYAMLAADFVFAVQLLVYAGGVMVILLFVILLSGKPSDWTGRQVNENVLYGALAALLVGASIIVTALAWPMKIEVAASEPTTARLGELLIKEMLIPFEAIGLLLVVALVGAIYFSSKKKES